MRPAASSQNGGAGVNANSTPTCANAAHVGDPGRFERFCDQKLALARAFQKKAQSNSRSLGPPSQRTRLCFSSLALPSLGARGGRSGPRDDNCAGIGKDRRDSSTPRPDGNRENTISVRRRVGDAPLRMTISQKMTDQVRVGGFAEEGRQADFQQARRSRFSSKPSSGPTTVAAILRGSKNSMAVCCTSSAVTASIEACNSSTLKKRPK